uniref:Ig-like domain-containing protein n=1 Tax=Rhinolophus ferrumequinum TaxID=59479 RepID=A0A671G2B7_RHIFE
MPLKICFLSSITSANALTIILLKSFMPRNHRSVLFSPGRAHGDSVSQMEGPVTLSEGSSLNVSCSYEASGNPTLFWYVQYPREGPQLLLKAFINGEKGRNKGFEATYHKESKSFHLEKASVHESDSAMYYCALSDTGQFSFHHHIFDHFTLFSYPRPLIL